MRMICAFLLLSATAFAQTAAQSAQLPSAPAAQSAQEQNSALAPTAPVITIEGFCPGTQETGPACKTEISREQFEKIADSLQVPENRKAELAKGYAQLLVLDHAAEQRGIANSPRTQEVMKFMRMQTLAQLLVQNLREEATKIPAADIQNYYNEHKDDFTQATLQRIFIPTNAPGEQGKVSEAQVKEEAGKMETAAKASGADFAKLQKQVYDDLKISVTPPPVDINDLRRQSLPPNQQAIFDLAPGAVSAPLNEPGGIYIYKLVSKKVLPETQVENEIRMTLGQKRAQADMETVMGHAKPVLNEAYFGTDVGPGAAPSLGKPTGTPGAPPASKVPAPAPKSSPKTPR